MVGHVPLMSKEEVQRRRLWQEQVYGKKRGLSGKQVVRVLGREFVVLPGFFPPAWADSRLLAEAVSKEAVNGERALDLGTGTGIHGIFAALKGAVVEAVDINRVALQCAEMNAERNGVGERMKVFESDLFGKVQGKFDLIVFNPPFRWFKPRDMLERGSLDENYETLKRFFREVRAYLNEKGRILMVFSDSGDLAFFERLIKENSLESEKIAKAEQDGWKYFVFRLRA